MRIRTVLLSWLVTILLAAPGFAQIVNDERGNCPSKDANGDWLCSAANYGDVNAPGVRSVFNLLVIGVTETGILTNTGSVAYNVVIEQGLRWGDGVKVTPGQSINIAPLDNGIFSWAVWAPVIIVSPDIASQAKALIHINARTPPKMTCEEVCTTRWNGCHQGCSLDPHTNAWCRAGCDSAQYLCLDRCAHR